MVSFDFTFTRLRISAGISGDVFALSECAC
jgi:hypothetical protein